MTFLVIDSCIRCKYTDCVAVCPVDCFREGPNMLVIDPEECIDCSLCVPECPIDAIYAEDDLPKDKQEYIALNAELAKNWPVITTMASGKKLLSDADKWKDVTDKLQYLERKWKT